MLVICDKLGAVIFEYYIFDGIIALLDVIWLLVGDRVRFHWFIAENSLKTMP